MSNVALNAVNYAKEFVGKILKPGSSAIDATAGNGNDTIFMSELVTETGRVYSFEIQAEAIQNTERKLTQHNIRNVQLINDGHQYMDKYIEEPVDAVMFNLGYMPKGNHKIVTMPDTSVKACVKALDLLKAGGIITIVCYTGHVGGIEEQNALEELLSKLDQQNFTVFKGAYLNQINNPPFLYVIEKRN